MPENSDREAWTDQLAGPRPARPAQWTATFKPTGRTVGLRYVGQVLGVVGPWQIVDPGGELDGKYTTDWDVTDLVRLG